MGLLQRTEYFALLLYLPVELMQIFGSSHPCRLLLISTFYRAETDVSEHTQSKTVPILGTEPMASQPSALYVACRLCHVHWKTEAFRLPA